MPRVKLHQRFADQICANVGQKKSEWFDLSLKGFYLEVRDTGGKTWRLRLQDESGKGRVINIGDASCVSYEEAKKRAKDLRAAAQIGQWGMVSPKRSKSEPQILFSDFVNDRYLPYAQTRKRSINTDISVLNNHLLPAFGSRRLGEITKLELVSFHTAKRQEGYAAGTVDRMVILFRFMMNLAIKWELITKDQNPAAQFEFFNEPNARERYLTQEEVQRLMAELDQSTNLDLRNIITALLITGCRKREILDAKWSDISLERNIWTIPITKQGRPHNLPITGDCKRFLLTLPSRGQSIYLFPSPRTGLPYRSIFQSWDRVRRNAGMPELRIHDLRHSFASFLVNSGRSLYEVQRLLGHTSSRTTQRYAHLSNDSLAEAMTSANVAVLPALESA